MRRTSFSPDRARKFLASLRSPATYASGANSPSKPCFRAYSTPSVMTDRIWSKLWCCMCAIRKTSSRYRWKIALRQSAAPPRWLPRILPSVGSGWNVSENRQSRWRAAMVRKADRRRTRAPMTRYFGADQRCLPTIGGCLARDEWCPRNWPRSRAPDRRQAQDGNPGGLQKKKSDWKVLGVSFGPELQGAKPKGGHVSCLVCMNRAVHRNLKFAI